VTLSTEWLIAIAVAAFVLLVLRRRKGGHRTGSFFTGIAGGNVTQTTSVSAPRPEPSGKTWLDWVNLLLVAVGAVAAALAIYQFAAGMS
jgi:hypothetical protein